MPTTTFELLVLQIANLEVSSLCSHGDISKNTPGSAILNFCRKHNENALHLLQAEVRICAGCLYVLATPIS